MKIDMHVHAQERSFCSRSSEEEMIQAAITAGLDALVFTDHDRLVPRARLTTLNVRYAPFRVFGGIEVSLGLEHILVFGVQDPALEDGNWTYHELHDFVEARQGFLALAHPYRFRRRLHLDFMRLPPHGAELRSHNTPKRAASRIRDLASELDLVLLCNSDAHHVSDIGTYYNVIDEIPEDDAGLVAALTSGALRCPS
ncbi:MAG: PHP-associated domain-containing protein [Anaerolineae bacterium]